MTRRHFVKSLKPTLLLILALIPSVESALAEATLERRLRYGAKVFKSCANCHTLEKVEGTRVGPTLYGIVGREIASIEGFPYSHALKSREGVWTERELDIFLSKPRHALPGTNMRFGGLLSNHARLDLIEYLKHRPELAKTKTDSLPEILDKGDANRGAALSRPCLTCHTVYESEGNSIGPNLHKIFGREIGASPNFNYSEDLMRREGVWNSYTLNAFIFEDKTFTQGSHAAFLKPGAAMTDRADLIAWLKTLR